MQFKVASASREHAVGIVVTDQMLTNDPLDLSDLSDLSKIERKELTNEPFPRERREGQGVLQRRKSSA